MVKKLIRINVIIKGHKHNYQWKIHIINCLRQLKELASLMLNKKLSTVSVLVFKLGLSFLALKHARPPEKSNGGCSTGLFM